MIVDSHCHYFKTFGYMRGLELNELISHMDNVGVDKSVVFTLEGLFHDYQLFNDEIFLAYLKYPDRLIPFGTINPWFKNKAIEEMERCVYKLSFKGFKLHPWMSSFPINSELMYPIADKASQLGVPFFVHSGTPPWSEPFQIAQIAEMFPKVIFIMGHMGLPDLWKEAIVSAQNNKNVFLETSGAPSCAIKAAVNEVGSDRVIFGSDMPFGGKENILFQIEKIRLLNFKKVDEDKIFSENIRRIIRLDK